MANPRFAPPYLTQRANENRATTVAWQGETRFTALPASRESRSSAAW